MSGLGLLRDLGQIYSEARLLQEGATDVEYEVYVLKGGFTDFQKLYRVSRVPQPPAHFSLAISTLRSFSMIPSWLKTGTDEHGIRLHRL